MHTLLCLRRHAYTGMGIFLCCFLLAGLLFLRVCRRCFACVCLLFVVACFALVPSLLSYLGRCLQFGERGLQVARRSLKVAGRCLKVAERCLQVVERCLVGLGHSAQAAKGRPEQLGYVDGAERGQKWGPVILVVSVGASDGHQKGHWKRHTCAVFVPSPNVWPMSHGAYGDLQPGRNERAKLAMAPTRGPAHPYSHAKAQHLGHPWVPGLPGIRLGPPGTTVPKGPGAPQAGGTP